MQKKSWHQNFKRAPKVERTGPDGFVYDSKTEMQRGCYLKLLERIGDITKLERQKTFQLLYNGGCSTKPITVMAGAKVAIYTADFIYIDKSGNEIIEDVKGYRDESSKFRIRVFEAFYDRTVTIIMKKSNRWVVA